MLDAKPTTSRDPDDGASDRLLSEADFRRKLEAFLTGPTATGFAIRLRVLAAADGAHLATYEAGSPPTDLPSQSRMLLEDEAKAVTCQLELWREGGFEARRADPNALADEVSALVARHWGDREPGTMLPYLKSSDGPAKFAAAARRLAASGRPVAVLHTDLDHFKPVNDKFGEHIGDSVLREFGNRFRDVFQGLGVTVRTGGEEFSALLGCDDISEILNAAEELRRRMETEALKDIGQINTCSIGLCLLPDAERFGGAVDQNPILEGARAAERRAKDEGRNRIALVGPRPAQASPVEIGADELRDAALTARRRQIDANMVASFRSAVQNRIVRALAETQDVAASIQIVRDRLSLLIGHYDVGDDRPPALQGILSSLEWASVVAGALLEATSLRGAPLTPTDSLALEADASGALALDISGRKLQLGCDIQTSSALRGVIGAPFYDAGTEPEGGVGRLPILGESTGLDPLSPVLLLPIGDVAKSVADGLRHLVAAVVDVDDRPTKGGGLPDFWQSNVSRVIRAALANPNITAVVAVGDADNARLTLERLRAETPSDTNELQRRLSMKAEDLTAFTARSLTVSSVPATRADVLGAIEAAVEALRPLKFANRPKIDQQARARRRLPIGAPDQAHRLAITDGLRVRTLADAYPEALQLVRGVKDAPASRGPSSRVEHASDQVEPNRGTFREMTGFKLVLTEPLADQVPDYWHEDLGHLEDYYQKSFRSPDGLFGSRLLRPFGQDNLSMTEFAASQTAEAAARRAPTRRINLPVLPDALEQPLGLSSIQVMPRVRGGALLLDTIFVWRTVDALVGLPFSAFGSIRWAEDFLAAVNADLDRQGNGEVGLTPWK